MLVHPEAKMGDSGVFPLLFLQITSLSVSVPLSVVSTSARLVWNSNHYQLSACRVENKWYTSLLYIKFEERMRLGRSRLWRTNPKEVDSPANFNSHRSPSPRGLLCSVGFEQ